MLFWPGLRSGKGSPPAGAACGALASTLAPVGHPAGASLAGSGVAGSEKNPCAARDPHEWS